MSRITESEIAEIVEAYLKEKSSGQASIQELVREIPEPVTLSAEDLAQSITRKNEAVFEQQVRNITSHKDTPGNAIFEGKQWPSPAVYRYPARKPPLRHSEPYSRA